MSTLKMHRYIIGWVGIVIAFSATFPIAMMRVSQTEKFAGQPFNSLTCDGQKAYQRQMVAFSDCAAMKVEPLPVSSPSSQPAHK